MNFYAVIDVSIPNNSNKFACHTMSVYFTIANKSCRYDMISPANKPLSPLAHNLLYTKASFKDRGPSNIITYFLCEICFFAEMKYFCSLIQLLVVILTTSAKVGVMEKRNFTRVSFSAGVAIRCNGQVILGDISNVSLQGLFIKTNAAIPTNMPVEVTVYPYPKKTFSLHADVVRRC